MERLEIEAVDTRSDVTFADSTRRTPVFVLIVETVSLAVRSRVVIASARSPPVETLTELVP